MQTLTQSLHDNLRKQAHVEYQSSLLYLNWAYWFDNQNFRGTATYFKKEAEEERKHSIQILDFLNVRGYSVAVSPAELTLPEQGTYEKPYDVFNAYKQREDANFTFLNGLSTQALTNEATEPLTLHFINQLLEDQTASCDEITKIHAKAKAYSAVPALFFHLDAQLATSSQNFSTWRK